MIAAYNYVIKLQKNKEIKKQYIILINCFKKYK